MNVTDFNSAGLYAVPLFGACFAAAPLRACLKPGLMLLRCSLVAWCLEALICGCSHGAQALTRAQMPPNIILVLAQNLGTNDLGCYGSNEGLTPNLDRLAASGVRFTRCYAGSPLSLPARATLLTGLHTGHGPIRGFEPAMLTRQHTTVSEVLKRRGYHTAAIGLWGLASPDTAGIPSQKGFDDWLGFLSPDHARVLYPNHLWRNDKILVLQDNADGVQSTSCQALFTRAATNFISVNRDNPFFLYLAYTLPGNLLPLTNTAGPEHRVQTLGRSTLLKWLDRDIGRVLAILDHWRLQSNTVVFFSSDGPKHATALSIVSTNSPDQAIDLDSFLEGRLRVPMLVRWPGVFPAGRVSDFPWAFWDFLPTAADIAQSTRPEDLDGLSILNTLLGKPQKPHDYFYWEVSDPGHELRQVVQSDNWKAISLASGASGTLFNLVNDPGERTNVAALHPQVWNRLANLMKQARADLSPSSTRP